MPILTPQQIGVLIHLQGKWGPGGSAARVEKFLDTAIAVAYGESGWDTDAVNKSSQASGLFQILPSAHADKIGGRNLLNPAVNVDVAAQVYQEAENAGRDPWSPWEAYTKKTAKYKAGLGHGKAVYAYLSSATKKEITAEYIEAVTGVKDVKIIPEDEFALETFKDTPAGQALDTAKDWGNWLAAHLIGAAYFIAAITLIVLGVIVIVSSTKAGKAVGNVIPTKRALKLVS